MKAGGRGWREGQEDGRKRGIRCMYGNAIVKHIALYASLKEDKEIHWEGKGAVRENEHILH